MMEETPSQPIPMASVTYLIGPGPVFIVQQRDITGEVRSYEHKMPSHAVREFAFCAAVTTSELSAIFAEAVEEIAKRMGIPPPKKGKQ